MSATAFIEDRTSLTHHICQCGGPIGRGDHYRREAIPPWGWEDPEGRRYSTGEWLILKLCHDCRPRPGV